MKYAYYNGKIILEKDVVISHRDLGFLRGYGIMDALKTVNGKPFLLEEHLRRLQNGLEALNLKWTITVQEFDQIIKALINKSELTEDVAVKTVVTGGKSSNGLAVDGEPTVLITINDLANVTPDRKVYETGAGVVLVEFQRHLPRVKTINYIAALQHQKEKEDAKATDMVYYSKGMILEGSTSNIFIVKNGEVITPLKNILFGTTRNCLVKLFKNQGVVVREGEVSREKLLSADEVFLTGTFKDVLPVVKVDDTIINSGNIGEKTKQGMELLKSAMK
jgi:branched-subunit amino acid aminotransferase/4-amino-4-deoxychorismate lyase